MNTGILIVLIIAVAGVIYFMKRKAGGCCGHSHDEHSNQAGHSSGDSSIGTTKDPVCGMTVKEDNSAGTAEYKGNTYYFCAPGCRESFEKEPEKYLKGEVEHGQKHGCCG